MMINTTDQYIALHQLNTWYHKYNHQVIEISGSVGTGVDKIISQFIELQEFDPREVMYLSLDQKQVLEMAYKRYHAYYLNNIIYTYIREVSFDTLSVINPKSPKIEAKIVKKIKKKLPDPRYKIMVVYDSVLLSRDTLQDLMSFGLPIILIRDPFLMPVKDTYTYTREAEIRLTEVDPVQANKPLIHFAHQLLNDEKLSIGGYDAVNIISKKNLNLYNLKSADMMISLTDETANDINNVYRERVLHITDGRNVPNERMIAMNTIYTEKLVNPDEKHVKVYLTKGTVGTLSKCPRHALSTRYIPIDFKPDFYHDSFEEMYIDRYILNGVSGNTRQAIPDEILYVKYAYALPVGLARLSHWDKVILMIDYPDVTSEIYRSMIYTAVTRCTGMLTMVI